MSNAKIYPDFRELLRRDGRSIRRIAEACGLSRSYLHHLAAGTRRADEDARRRIAAGMGLYLGVVTRALSQSCPVSGG